MLVEWIEIGKGGLTELWPLVSSISSLALNGFEHCYIMPFEYRFTFVDCARAIKCRLHRTVPSCLSRGATSGSSNCLPDATSV